MQAPESPTSDMQSDMQSDMEIVQMLRAVQEEARRKIDTTLNPKAQALLEVTAEVIGGLIRAYEDFEQGQERAWQ